MPQQTIVAQNLKDELKNVPQKIRDWFNLEKVTDLIINLNTELGLESKIEAGPKFKPASEKATVIPLLILRLQIKDLEPQNFTQELSSQLNVDYETAKSIAREIKKQILEPISQALLRWEVDTNRIAVSGLLGLSEIKLPTIKKEVKPEVKIEKEIEPKPLPVEPPTETQLKPFDETQGKPAPFLIAPTTPTVSTPVVPATPVSTGKPFILHQETEARPVGEKQRVSSPATNWFQKNMLTGRQEKPRTPVSPVKIELEVFGQKSEELFGKAQGSPFGAIQGKEKEPVSAKTEAPKQRIVHYRETEISTPFGKPETQPRKTEMPMPAATKTEAPKPKEPKIVNFDSFATTKEKENEVGLEGNTINLKNNQ